MQTVLKQVETSFIGWGQMFNVIEQFRKIWFLIQRDQIRQLLKSTVCDELWYAKVEPKQYFEPRIESHFSPRKNRWW